MEGNLEHNELLARWLDGRLTEEERSELDASGELDALGVVMQEMDTWKVAPFDVESGLERLKKENGGVKHLPQRNNRAWWGIAAGFAALFAGVLTYFLSGNNTITQTTGIAERETVELPMGTVVQLDAQSSISYNKKNWATSREIQLQGQAYFDVTSGSPFRVTSQTAAVHVLGTQFNIKAIGERFVVSCYEGKVRVDYKGQKETITKGQTVTLEGGNLVPSSHADRVPSWFKGFTLYEKTPLEDVVSDLKNYYDVEVALPSRHQGLLFTGRLYHNNLERTLELLFASMELEYSVSGDGKVTVN